MGVDAREFPGGLLRLDPAFAYAEPPSSWPLSWVECLTLAPGSDRIPVELLQILTQYAICRLPARSHKQLLSLRSPCGSEYNFHSLVTQAARKQGQSHVTRRETKDMGCHVTKKSINRARQRLVVFVSWAISPGIGKSSSFRHMQFSKLWT